MEIVPLGDSALIVRVRDRFEDAPDEALNEVLRTLRRLEDATIPGVIELVPAYTTVAVFFDPMVVANAGPKSDQALDWLTERVRAVVAGVGDPGGAADYRVNCIGFTPGFPFLTGLPKTLATPRRATPRKEIPAGSVGIGGAQTGIYPLRSPGGWNLIGRTPFRLFDPARNPPVLLSAGDRVRFRAITREEFAATQR